MFGEWPKMVKFRPGGRKMARQAAKQPPTIYFILQYCPWKDFILQYCPWTDFILQYCPWKVLSFNTVPEIVKILRGICNFKFYPSKLSQEMYQLKQVFFPSKLFQEAYQRKHFGLIPICTFHRAKPRECRCRGWNQGWRRRGHGCSRRSPVTIYQPSLNIVSINNIWSHPSPVTGWLLQVCGPNTKSTNMN